MRDDHLNQDEARALRMLADELRSAPPPELDWDRVEAELMRRRSLEATARRQRGVHSAWGSVAAFAAAAAAVVLMITSSARQDVALEPDEPTPVAVDLSSIAAFPQQPDSLPRYQVRALAPNAVVESGAEPLQLGLEGVATWTLAPHSRAVVRSTKVPHVVVLERGAIFAEVVPRHDTSSIVEAFVVEVAGTRVAVHGTVFSVERADDLINVEVTRGAVTVGPASYRGPTTGLLLTSPARAAFNASTGAFVRRLPFDAHQALVMPPSAPQKPRAQLEPVRPRADEAPAADAPAEGPNGKATQNPSTEGSAPKPAEPGEPAPPAPTEVSKLSAGQAATLISSCLRQNAKDKTFIISSNVTLHLLEDGEVGSMQFSPPLNPKFQAACGGLLFGKLIDGSGSVSFAVSSK